MIYIATIHKKIVPNAGLKHVLKCCDLKQASRKNSRDVVYKTALANSMISSSRHLARIPSEYVHIYHVCSRNSVSEN